MCAPWALGAGAGENSEYPNRVGRSQISLTRSEHVQHAQEECGAGGASASGECVSGEKVKSQEDRSPTSAKRVAWGDAESPDCTALGER